MESEAGFDATTIIGAEFPEMQASYNTRDLLIYALGVGATDLRFTYEDHGDFAALPTYPVVLGFKGTSQEVVPFPPPSAMAFPDGFPPVNPAMILHGEEFLELYKPLPPTATLTVRGKLLGIYDKGKGALMEQESTYFDERGERVCRVVIGSFIRGLTGVRGPPQPRAPSYAPPPRPADAVVTQATRPDQAVLYRLSGDYNSLHIDPDVAESVGYDRPILHGLCTFGFAARAVLATFCDNDPSRFHWIKVRFSKPVFPGETLETSMWKDGDTVTFTTRVVERDVQVLSNAAVGIRPMSATESLYEPLSLPTQCIALREGRRVQVFAHHLDAPRRVFFIHGSMANLHQFDFQISHLLERSDIGMVAADAYGCGGSEKPNDWDAFREDELFADLVELFTRFRARGDGTNILVAHSAGTCFATRLAAHREAGRGVGGVVLIGGSATRPAGMASPVFLLPWIIAQPLRGFMDKGFVRMAFHEETPQPLKQRSLLECASNEWHVCQAYYRQFRWEIEEDLDVLGRRIQAAIMTRDGGGSGAGASAAASTAAAAASGEGDSRTLDGQPCIVRVLVGDSDALTPVDTARTLAGRLGFAQGPDHTGTAGDKDGGPFKLLVVPKASHQVMQEQPAVVNEQIDEVIGLVAK